MSSVFEELQWRGLIAQYTEGVPEGLTKERITVYNGFDPTADSLHVGHLIPMVGLARLQRFGHTPIVLAGGGTGMVGDPSGRSSERNLLTTEQVDANVEKIKGQLTAILDFEVKSNPAQLHNNATWLRSIGFIDFLRDVGKHFTINYMLAKDSVQGRIERESGLSYTEFSYMLLQAYDFLYLYDHVGCTMQTGGTDQWGNITAGTTYIRKVRGVSAHALVHPLITRADGTKFGKSADGEAIWLDPQRTSPYRFYQFFVNAEDSKVVEYLRFYTFLSQEEIAQYEDEVKNQPHLRSAQKRLAQEVTRLVHGESAVAKAEQATHVLFGGTLEGLSSADIADIFAEVPTTTLPHTTISMGGMPLVELLAKTTLVTSKGDARRQLQNGAISVNNVRAEGVDQQLSAEHLLHNQYILLRKGRKEYHLVHILS